MYRIDSLRLWNRLIKVMDINEWLSDSVPVLTLDTRDRWYQDVRVPGVFICWVAADVILADWLDSGNDLL